MLIADQQNKGVHEMQKLEGEVTQNQNRNLIKSLAQIRTIFCSIKNKNGCHKSDSRFYFPPYEVALSD